MLICGTTLIPVGDRFRYWGSGGGLNWEGEQTKWRAADRMRCLHFQIMGGSEASPSSAPIAVALNQFLVYLRTLCQKELSFLIMVESGTNRLQP